MDDRDDYQRALNELPVRSPPSLCVRRLTRQHRLHLIIIENDADLQNDADLNLQADQTLALQVKGDVFAIAKICNRMAGATPELARELMEAKGFTGVIRDGTPHTN